MKIFFALLKLELLTGNTNTELSNKLRFLKHFSEQTDDYPKFNFKTIDFKAELKTDLSCFFSVLHYLQIACDTIRYDVMTKKKDQHNKNSL